MNSFNLSRCNKRFDFGVPLEDIFPPNDIHPRLKYLFEEAYRVFLKKDFTIHQLLRQYQGPLEIRLKLKEKIIFDTHYHIRSDNDDEYPGMYFWVIRHFLGLLPIPLLPEYANDTHFTWKSLSEKCHRFLRHYENERRNVCHLDFEIAEHLNLLPFEHFLLMSIVIIFIRKLATKPIPHAGHLSRRSLLYLTKYFCPAITSRPYRPGHNEKDEKIFPLFFYLCVRWHYIEKHCKKNCHPAYFLETDCLNFNSYRGVSLKSSSVQTSMIFCPELVTATDITGVTSWCNTNNCLKDIGCQTDLKEFINTLVQDIIKATDHTDNNNNTTKEGICHINSKEAIQNITTENINDKIDVKVVIEKCSPSDDKVVKNESLEFVSYNYISDSECQTALKDVNKTVQDIIQPIKETIDKVVESNTQADKENYRLIKMSETFQNEKLVKKNKENYDKGSCVKLYDKDYGIFNNSPPNFASSPKSNRYMKINQHKISESQNFVPDLKGASECFYESSPKLYDYAEIYAPSSTPKKKYSSCKISHSRNVFEDLCNEKIGKKKIEGDSDLVSTDNSPKETDKRSGNSRRCSRNSGFSFTSDADSKEWSDIVEETTKTVSKVEQYIYDDYETFKNEDYNQIICSNNTCNSLFEKVSRLGWTYTPRHTLPKSTADNFADKNDPTKMYYHHTYFKFEDVCEKDGNLKIEYGNKPRENTPQSNSCGSLNIAFKRSDHLNIPLWDNPIYGDKEMTHDEPKTKSSFSLKRFKINLDFFRVLTPSRLGRRSPSYENIDSKIKYKKIKNVKSTAF